MQSKFYENSGVNQSDLYLNTKEADVFFVFEDIRGDMKRIPAHKKLLVPKSKVFKAMFEGPLQENGDVKIIGVSFISFARFLEFFYLSEVKITLDHVSEMMHLGDRYDVEKCVNDCALFLAEVADNENVCTVLHCAILFHQIELMNICEKHLIFNTSAVFESADFLNCEKSVLEHILQMDCMSCREIEVFTATMNWVKAKTGPVKLTKAMVEEHLGDLYYKIRFRSITIEEFCSLPPDYDLLLSMDFQTIAKMIVVKGFEPDKFAKTLRRQAFEDAI